MDPRPWRGRCREGSCASGSSTSCTSTAGIGEIAPAPQIGRLRLVGMVRHGVDLALDDRGGLHDIEQLRLEAVESTLVEVQDCIFLQACTRCWPRWRIKIPRQSFSRGLWSPSCPLPYCQGGHASKDVTTNYHRVRALALVTRGTEASSKQEQERAKLEKRTRNEWVCIEWFRLPL